MPQYQIEIPGQGKFNIDSPQELNDFQVYQAVQKQLPALQAKEKERTFGEATKDVGASLVSGIGSLTQLPGQLYGLATGNMERTGTLGLGKDIEEYGQSMKSKGLQAQEAARSKAIEEAEKKGQLSAMGTAISQTISNPALLISFLAEQLPNMLVPGGAAVTAGRSAAAKAAAAGLGKEAVESAAVKSGTRAAVGAGAVQQGADVGAGSYESIYDYLVKEQNKSPEQAAAETINLARAAGASGALISLLAQRLPGAQAFERALAGQKTGAGVIMGGVTGAAKEIPGEIVEETGGRFSQNLAMRDVNAQQSLTQGLGETAGMAAIGAAGMGGAAGALAGRGAPSASPAAPVPPVGEAPPPVTDEAPPPAQTLEPQLVEKPTEELKDIPEAVTASTPDVEKLKAEIAKLEAANLDRDKKIKQGLDHPRRKEKYKRTALEIEQKKAQLQALVQGEQNAGQPISTTGGEGAPLAGATSTDTPAAGTGQAGPTGVVPTGTDAASPVAGETGKPPTVTTQGTPSGIKTPETQQAKTQGQATAPYTPIEIVDGELRRPYSTYEKPTPPAPPEPKKPVRPTRFKTTEALAKEDIQAAKKAAGEAYNADRDLIKFENEDTDRLFKEVSQGKLPDDMPLESARLNNILKENNIIPTDVYADKSPINRINRILKARRVPLPSWTGGGLTSDAKEIYLSYYKPNDPTSRRRAISATFAYVKALKTMQAESAKKKAAEAAKLIREQGFPEEAAVEMEKETLKKETPKQLLAAPEAGIYERNRNEQKRKDGVAYPLWTDLTEKQRKGFKDSLAATGAPLDKTTALQHNAAFKTVADSMRQEGRALPPGKTNADLAAARLKESESKAKTRAQEEIKREQDKAEQTQERAPKKVKDEDIPDYLGENPFAKPSTMTDEQEAKFDADFAKYRREEENKNKIPDNVVEQIKKNNLKGVLQYLRSGSKNPLFKALAQRLFETNLNTKIELVDSLPNGDLAVYDPASDTIKVTPDGLKDVVLLHETTHAATVDVLFRYYSSKGQKLTPAQAKALGVETREVSDKPLTEQQIEAVQQLENIMKVSREELSDVYPDAYKDIYEFVAYALTDRRLQNDLAKLDKRVKASTLPKTKSLWSQFVLNVAKLFGLDTVIFGKKGTVKAENLIPELFAAFEHIIAVPKGGIPLAPLPSIAAPAVPDKTRSASFEQQVAEAPKLNRPYTADAVKKLFSTVEGGRTLLRRFVNDRHYAKMVQVSAEMIRKVIYSGEKVNAFYDQISLAMGRAKYYYDLDIEPSITGIHEQVKAIAKERGVNPEFIMDELHVLKRAVHEEERRTWKFKFYAPLTEAAAKERGEIIQKYREGKKLTDAEIKVDRDRLEEFIDPSKGYLLENGWSWNNDPKAPVPATDKSSVGYKSTDINSDQYNVITNLKAQSHAEVRVLAKERQKDPKYKKLFEMVQDLQNKTIELNKRANYWSDPVANVVKLYDFKNYVPFKGRPDQVSDRDAQFDIKTGAGRELQEYQNTMEGRVSDADNVIVQTMLDAGLAAARAGRSGENGQGVTLAIKNAIDAGIIDGNTKEKIKFEDRYLGSTDLARIRKLNVIFHYEPDGTITLLKIDDKQLNQAIRRTYTESNPVIDFIGQGTSLIGQFHTRYNIPFAPANFLIDGLTNAFNISAQYGVGVGAKYMKELIGSSTLHGGLHKAGTFSSLYAAKRFDAIDKLAAEDPFYRDLYDYVKAGGRVSYAQSLTTRGIAEEFDAVVKGQNVFVQTKKGIDKVVDVWTDSFELASRVAAFRIAKAQFMSEDKGMTDADASAKAIAYAKGLSNFEQVGELGKVFSAFFMFFRPAATGAGRAIESLAPALLTAQKALDQLPNSGLYSYDEKTFRQSGKKEYKNLEAVEAFKKEHNKKRVHARATVGALLGMGMAVYAMSAAFGDDDDQGRNKTLTDDPARWTRYARFHYSMGDRDFVFQLPWGFGLGAIAAAGAQIAAYTHGAISRPEGDRTFWSMMGNIAEIGTDSFLPIQPSRIDKSEEFTKAFVDSLVPSLLRPIFEYAMNTDALGRDIYNENKSDVSEALMGSDSVPEMYKATSKWMYDNLGIAVRPNVMYFFANNYADGLARLAGNGVNTLQVAMGEKEFNPRTDTILFDRFFGSYSDVDAREFSKVSDKMRKIHDTIKTLKDYPERYAQYVENNPTHEIVSELYNKEINGDLKKIREQKNEFRRMDISPKERDQILRTLSMGENIIKHNLTNFLTNSGIDL